MLSIVIMNKLTTDLKSLHEATLNNLKSSKANNTLRAYKSDLYALNVLFAFELFKLFKVASWSDLRSVVNLFIITIDNN